MRRLLVVPVHLAGLGVHLHQRVGVEVGAGPARSEGVFRRARDRARVAGAEVHRPFFVEGRRVPEAAAGVDFGIAPEALRHGVEAPRFLAGLAVERPEDPDAAAAVEFADVDGHRRDVDEAFAGAGRHVDALRGVAGEGDRPQLFAGLLVEREGAGGGGAVDATVLDHYPVRPVVGRFVFLRPEDFAALEVNCLHVGLEVLRVDHAFADDRRGRVAAEGALRFDRQRPRFFQFGNRGEVDRAADEAGVRLVDVRIARAGEVGRAGIGIRRAAATGCHQHRTEHDQYRRHPSHQPGGLRTSLHDSPYPIN